MVIARFSFSFVFISRSYFSFVVIFRFSFSFVVYFPTSFSREQDHREPESAVRLFGVDLLAGLQQTHACGYLHGDLRPSNVLIDEYGILKLSGFGLARAVSESGEAGGVGGGEAVDTSSGQQQQQQGGGGVEKAPASDGRLPGRDPTYMAPELLSRGEGAMSFASDFWSLGCVLFELLTGEPPFCASASATTAERIVREVSEEEGTEGGGDGQIDKPTQRDS